MKIKAIFLSAMLFINTIMLGQNTQTVRGVIEDNDSKSPLVGATVIIVDSDPIIGAVSDTDGNFRIANVPLGRVSIKISFLGYEDRIIPNLLVGSGKETVLKVKLIESFENLDGVVITINNDKSQALNEMSLVSARAFSVDETKRFAGSFADPARMVTGFAGVANPPEGNNDIIVRGNSPRGILWRLEGVEIPNPNHFASEGSTGGPINALNSNMLTDSDFMTGAFSPEYGNALSGVFDMRLRRGNNETREYNIGLSTLGLDITAEGPFKKGYSGSYIANYRYSALDLVDKLGIVDFGGVPRYQDLSFKINLPFKQGHSLSLFGLGGISSISGDTQEDENSPILAKSKFGTRMATVGVTHSYLINNRSFIKSNLSFSSTRLRQEEDLPYEGTSDEFYNAYNSDIDKAFLRVSSTYNYKFNSRNKLEVGAVLIDQSYSINQNYWDFELDKMKNILSDNGSALRAQSFLNWKFRMRENLAMVSGVHFMYFDLNKSYNIEPRLALKWNVTNLSALNIGFGLHSRMESISTYLYKEYIDDQQYYQPNINLQSSKAIHFVVGYEQKLGDHTNLKAEVYYQDLYDVPIEDIDTSTFSMINAWDELIDRHLVNQGSGRNYGLELTVEQYLNKGFYYLGSASVFNSLYTPMDGVERKSAYASDYILNFLGGKEFSLGKPDKNRVFFVNGKLSLIGGKRYTPIDLETSISRGRQIRYEDRPFSTRSDDMFIFNLSFGIRRDKKNRTSEFKIDIQNLTNNQAVVNEYWIPGLTKVYQATQLPMFPTISYSVSF